MARKQSTAQFDPNSVNATLATIIANQAAHAKTMDTCFTDVRAELTIIKEQAFTINGRVGLLEVWRKTSAASRAGYAAALGLVGGISGWAVTVWLNYK